jgi:hypothetical protein
MSVTRAGVDPAVALPESDLRCDVLLFAERRAIDEKSRNEPSGETNGVWSMAPRC